MITGSDDRLTFNGQPALTEYNDNNPTRHDAWIHNATAARWNPTTGWDYPW